MKNLKVINKERNSQVYYNPNRVRLICWGYSPIESGSFEIAGEKYCKEICDIIECDLDQKEEFVKEFSKRANSDSYPDTFYHYIDAEGVPGEKPFVPPTFKETLEDAVAAVKKLLTHPDVESQVNYNILSNVVKTLEGFSV